MPDRPKIVYPDADSDENALHHSLAEQVRSFADFEIHSGKPATNAAYIDRIADANGILLGWDLPGEVMAQAPRLEVISFAGIGATRFIDMDLARKKDITVCNCPGYSDSTVAEHTLGLLFAVTRKIPYLDAGLRKGNWNQSEPAIELAGKCVGLVGFGGIGKRFARLCIAMGMKVKVWTRSMNPAYEEDYGVELCSLEQLCKTCEFISLHLAANEQTNGIIDTALIEEMQPGTVLINTARAELVDEDGMIAALESGQLGAAGLDVFHQEPLAPEHPLLAMDNVVLTPHTAFNTPEAVSRLYDIAVHNLQQYFSGEPLNSV